MKFLKYYPLMIFTILFSFLTYVSWFKWGGLYTDTFQDMRAAAQLLEGRKLYSEVFWIFGPFIPYLLTFFYKIFGIKILVNACIGIINTCICSFFIYRLSRLFIKKQESIVCVFFFLCYFAFSCVVDNDTFNFIIPYTSSSTFLITYVTGSLVFFIKYLKTNKVSYILGYSLCLSLGFFVRINLAILCLGCFIFIHLLYCIFNKKKSIKYQALTVIFVIIGYALIFFLTDNYDYLIRIFKIAFRSASGQNYFDIYLSGLNDPVNNILLCFTSFFKYCLFLFFIAVSVFFIRKKFNSSKITYTFCFISATILAAIYIWLYSIGSIVISYTPLLLCTLTYCIYHTVKKKRVYFELLAICLISLALMSRILFFPYLYSYIFYLGIPALVCFFIFSHKLFFDLLKTKLELNKELYNFSVSIFLLCLCMAMINNSLFFYNRKTIAHKFNNTETIFFSNELSNKVVLNAIEYIKNKTQKSDTLIAFPESDAFNVLSKRINPLDQVFVTPTIQKEYTQKGLIKKLIKHKIDYIIIFSRPMYEFNVIQFGYDFYVDTYKWIRKHYIPVYTINGNPINPKITGLRIYRRNDY